MTTMQIMWILGAAFALVGVPFIWLGRRARARDRVVASWPRADGVVTSSKLTTHQARYREKTGLDYYRTMYTPAVSYTYSVNGKSFEGTGIARAIDGMSRDQTSAQAIIDRYPAEKRISVFYDPADPKVAYLEHGRSIGTIIVLVFGWFWVGLGALLVGLSFL